MTIRHARTNLRPTAPRGLNLICRAHLYWALMYPLVILLIIWQFYFENTYTAPLAASMQQFNPKKARCPYLTYCKSESLAFTRINTKIAWNIRTRNHHKQGFVTSLWSLARISCHTFEVKLVSLTLTLTAKNARKEFHGQSWHFVIVSIAHRRGVVHYDNIRSARRARPGRFARMDLHFLSKKTGSDARCAR